MWSQQRNFTVYSTNVPLTGDTYKGQLFTMTCDHWDHLEALIRAAHLAI